MAQSLIVQVLLRRPLNDFHEKCATWLQGLFTKVYDQGIEPHSIHVIDETISNEVWNRIGAYQVSLIEVERL